jgi:hypothetical protein
MSPSIQRLTIHSLQPFAVSALYLLFQSLLDHPIYFTILGFLLLVGLIMIGRSYLSELSQDELNSIHPVADSHTAGRKTNSLLNPDKAAIGPNRGERSGSVEDEKGESEREAENNCHAPPSNLSHASLGWRGERDSSVDSESNARGATLSEEEEEGEEEEEDSEQSNDYWVSVVSSGRSSDLSPLSLNSSVTPQESSNIPDSGNEESSNESRDSFELFDSSPLSSSSSSSLSTDTASSDELNEGVFSSSGSSIT